MAKKKTENIKAAPVLRAHGDEQPTPTPEQTGTRTYQIMDPWKDRDVVNLVDVKAVDGAVTEVKVNGQPAGGGGGMQTARVTFKNTGKMPCALNLPILIDNTTQVTVAVIPPNGADTPIKSIILGPSGCESDFDETPASGSTTGGVNYDSGHVVITGDGTLTIS